MIKAVGFDWGGVLNGEPSAVFDQQIADLLEVTPQEYLDVYFKYNRKLNSGEITWEELWTLVLRDLGKANKLPEIRKLSQQGNDDSLNMDILELVDTLRRNGYKVGMLSNNIKEKATDLRAIGLDTHFDVFHISAETGFVKPEPAAFEHFSQELGVQLSELVFIDDSQKSLSTAVVCGFTPLHFENHDKLVSDLINLGLRF